MPISRKQFDAGIDDHIEASMRNVHRFLKENRDQAFTAAELAEWLLGNSRPLDESFRSGLQKLAELGAVQVHRIANQNYYAFRAELTDL